MWRLYVCVHPIFHPGGKYHQPNLLGHPLSVAPKVKRMNYILSFQCLVITIWLKLALVPHLMAYVDHPWKGLPGILWANEWLRRLDLVISGVDGRCDPDVILMFEDSIPL